jgi:hypothetical protein
MLRPVADWEERYRDGERRLPDDPDERQRQLTRMGNVAWAAGLTALVQGRRGDAVEWLGRAHDRYRESWEHVPPGSWGRPIAILKSRLLAGQDATADAEWTLAEGAAQAASPIGRYAACLALLVLGRDEEALGVAASLGQDFPAPVAEALVALAAGDGQAYADAALAVLRSFDTREEFLEDVRVADTVLVLQALAEERGLAAELPPSPLLPG